jgi:hypothetical protein
MIDVRVIDALTVLLLSLDNSVDVDSVDRSLNLRANGENLQESSRT